MKQVRNRKPIDLVGHRFGRLVVQERDPLNDVVYESGHKVLHWKCLCDCGTIISLDRVKLVKGSRVNCGCVPSENRKPYKSVNRLEGDVAAFNRLYQAYIANAKSRGFYFNLSKEQFKEMTKKNCYYCGSPPLQVKKHKVKSPRESYVYNGVDRLDSSIGYLPENCVPCCRTCNMMKQAHSPEGFIEHISKVYLYQQEKDELST